MKDTESEWKTINALAVLTLAERRHIARWLEMESVPSKTVNGRKIFEPVAAVTTIREHQRNPRVEPEEEWDEERFNATIDWLESRHLLLQRIEREVLGLAPGWELYQPKRKNKKKAAEWWAEYEKCQAANRKEPSK